MANAYDNLMLKHLKKIQAELKASRERDVEKLIRIKRIERRLELQS